MDGMSSVAAAEGIDFGWPLPEGLLRPFEQEEVVIRKREYIELKARANYYQAQDAQKARKIQSLEALIEKLKAQLRDVRQRFFGRRSEKSTAKQERAKGTAGEILTPPARAPRGQRRGSAGHGRTPLDHLPVVEEERDLSVAEKCCADCHLPLKAGPDRISEIIEYCTMMFRRRIVRKSYRVCRCSPKNSAERSEAAAAVTPEAVTPAAAALIAPPAPGRLIRKGKLGVSIWVEVLLDKFHHGRATNRLLQMWSTLGHTISPGTIAGGLKQLLPLMKPLMQAFKEQQLSEQLFHADETFWRVFEKLADKVGYRWYLWTFLSPSVCFYILDPSRSARVPLDHFGGLLHNVMLIVDRYSAYKKLPHTLSILLAFCWCHVRRDYLELARNYPPLEAFALAWVKRIGTLYHLNKERLKAGAAHFAACDAQLRAHLEQMQQQCAADLANPKLHPAARKCLESLQRHWTGLTLFLDHPEIEMDNNRAERMLRNAVCGRKNYYGSGACWSAELAASLFTVFMTLVHCWKINPRRWLTEYLQACAAGGGKAPTELSNFLPWQLSAQRLASLRTAMPMPPILFNTS
jgi:transposase